MSRCEAFSPPNYVWNGASCEALSEAIKVWRENAVAEKRRKNKEKRKRKRDFGELEEGEIREERSSHKHKKNKKVDENELSETSNLTEEHDQPICDSLYDSSDNTETSMPWLLGLTESCVVQLSACSTSNHSSENSLRISLSLPFGFSSSTLSSMIKNGSLTGDCPLKCLMLGIMICIAEALLCTHVLTICHRLCRIHYYSKSGSVNCTNTRTFVPTDNWGVRGFSILILPEKKHILALRVDGCLG
ncbi:hypothetical protein LWI29_002204 [Acer saccharum]|uniref:Uncharacterized protein n=1 Tax=Acer saccharum TaxID=4024 RepID=A0AA39UZ73_ACESA|nr:hypothetical protein LWI29_002204 [Acer saccharum]